MQPGVVPYSVNSPLWSDGAHKERFLAIPHKAGEDMRIGFSTNRGWNFPDETVLIKSFALEATQGDPASRRWIETRFLTKQAGEWVGYSYVWNDEQTDAELVAGEGTDREYEIRVPRSREHPDGLVRQKWRYPSRTECMVCHSRAANFVLGLSTAQMNKDHHYGKQTLNQLDLLEKLGVLKFNPKVKAKALVNPSDETADLNLRARSYLHANCSVCHIEAGGGNAQMKLEFDATDKAMNVLDVKPLHHQFNIPEARLIAPGDPDRSVLLHRVSIRDRGQMPQLATSLVDEAAVEMLRKWILTLKKEEEPAAK
jgi:uncharacterized repeat protein (TIGR03806 family)